MASMNDNAMDTLRQRVAEQVSEKELTLWKCLREQLVGPDGKRVPVLAFGLPVTMLAASLLHGHGNILERFATGVKAIAARPELIPAYVGLTAVGALGFAGVMVLEEYDTKIVPNKVRQRIFDSPEVQGMLEVVAEKAGDVLATQRGSVWIVSEMGREPVVLNQVEYEARKKTDWPNLDEVRLDTDKVTVMRYTDGKLDPGVDRIMPAVEVFPISQGTLDLANKSEGWFAKGRKVSVDFLRGRMADVGPEADPDTWDNPAFV